MSILTGFDSFINDAQKNQSIVDLDSKRRILQTLSAYGLPTRKEEEWRNTSLKFLTEFDFKPVSKAPTKISELGQSLLQQKIIPK